MPTHLAAAPGIRLRRASRAVLVTCAAFAAALVLALAAAGGTFAYFNSTTQLDAGTIEAGDAALKIQGVDHYTIAGLDTTKLLPGASVFTATPLTVANTGDASLSVAQGATSFATTGTLKDHLVVTVSRVATSATTCTAGAGTALGSGYTLAAGATMKVCVTVQLSAAAPGTVAGQTATFTVPLDAKQVRP